MRITTCRTEGCPNAGIPIENPPVDPDLDGPALVFCAPCGQEISDIEVTDVLAVD